MIDDLRPYSKMNDSGVPWLGQVPEHWRVQRLRNVAEMRVSNVDKRTSEGEEPVRLCNYVDVYKHDHIKPTMSFMHATASHDEIERFRLHRNDVLITKDSESWNDIGVPALVDEGADDLVSGYHLALLRPRRNAASGGYLFRALQSEALAYQFHVQANGVTRYGLSHSAIKSVSFPLPPPAEQAAIVRFLDHVDRKIRRAIRAKQKLVKLLEEEKQAIIHHAVTRGLDPNVRLKPSGVEWLGDVPEHWGVLRLRNLADMRVSNVDKHTKEGEQSVRLCNYVDVYKNDFICPSEHFMRASATKNEVERFRLVVGDVLITKDSEAWNDIGVPAIVRESADDLVSGYHLALLRPFEDKVLGEFLFRALQNTGTQYQFHVEAHGVTRYGLSHTAIKTIWLPVPPLSEQAAIVRFLLESTGRIVSAAGSAMAEITLLREYRTRLIADVVTGKLDVREAAARLPDEAPETQEDLDAVAEDEDAAEPEGDADTEAENEAA